jgi:hypothetical protein
MGREFGDGASQKTCQDAMISRFEVINDEWLPERAVA